MNSLFERVRDSWESLNDRERRMLSILGAVVASLLFLLPPVVLGMGNADIAAENDELRSVLDQLAMQHGRLAHLAEERKSADKRYRNKTPALGTFLESKAKEQGLTLQEVTDQPEKVVGPYLRRSVTVSLGQVGLSPVMNLLSSIVESPHPVAIDQIQIDHFQPGDQYNVKLGIVTYDQKSPAASKTTAAPSDDAESDG
jgi:type II secretory pathway component PulM